MWVQSLGQENPMEKGMATHSSILAWRAPWTEEPGGLRSMGSQRVRHDWASNTFTEKATVRENPFISWAWVGRKRLGTTWDTGGPGDSKGRRSHPWRAGGLGHGHRGSGQRLQVSRQLPQPQRAVIALATTDTTLSQTALRGVLHWEWPPNHVPGAKDSKTIKAF